MATDTKYTVLSYNINGYELIHPVKEKSNRAKYIMVTDDPDLKDESGTWDVVYDPELTGSPFDKVMQVRYNPFKYTNDFVVIKIDGSVGIEKNLDPLIDRFFKDEYDMSLMLHPTRNTMVAEYSAWVDHRGYNPETANNILRFMAMEGLDVENYKGLAQLCYQIQTNTRTNQDINRMTYSFLKYLGDSTGVERVDQCVFSFVLEKYFGGMKVMWVDQRMYNGQWFTWYAHNSNNAFKPIEAKELTEPYFFNKRLHNIVRPQDL